jgi:hypothetical protein
VRYFDGLHTQIKRKDMIHIFLVGKSSESYQLDALREGKRALEWALQKIVFEERRAENWLRIVSNGGSQHELLRKFGFSCQRVNYHSPY